MATADQTIGEVALQSSSKLVFSIGEWRGRTFASVRKFVATRNYEGPTKSGLVLSQKLLGELSTTLCTLENTIPLSEEQEFKRILKNNTEYIKVTTLPSENDDGLPAVDIREFVDSPGYSGPTKRGIRFKWNLLPEVIACLRQQVAVIGKQEGHEPSLFDLGRPDDNAEQQPQASGVDALAKLLGETLKQFPHDFVDSQVSKCLQMKLPEASLRLEQDSAGAFFLRTDEGHFCAVRNQTEANFILYAQLRGQHDLSVPIEMFQIFRTVKTYESYLRTLRAKLIHQVLKQARQKSVADYETDKLFRALGLPKLEQ